MPFEHDTSSCRSEDGFFGYSSAINEEIRLLGQPHLEDYLEFVKESVEGNAKLDRRSLCDEWRASNDYYSELEELEAGIADDAECLDLPQELEPLAATLTEHPYFHRTFDKLPVSFGMVELDRLIAYQTHVTLTFVEALLERLHSVHDSVALFGFCMPIERRDPPVRARQMGPNRFAFASESTDFRLHDTALLRGDELAGLESFGPVGAAVGIMVGFGCNFVNVIRSENRMMLNNGYHRVCALRAAGVTHAPAVIQTVTRRDELSLVAARAVREDPAFYFAAARPPLVKDFFDPRIRKVLPVRPMERLIEVTFEVRELLLPQA